MGSVLTLDGGPENPSAAGSHFFSDCNYPVQARQFALSSVSEFVVMTTNSVPRFSPAPAGCRMSQRGRTSQTGQPAKKAKATTLADDTTMVAGDDNAALAEEEAAEESEGAEEAELGTRKRRRRRRTSLRMR